MQGNATCHMAEKVMKWLSDMQVNIHEWSGNSPDLDPVEELWLHMKPKHQGKNISSILRLVEAIKDICVHDINLKYCRKQRIY